MDKLVLSKKRTPNSPLYSIGNKQTTNFSTSAGSRLDERYSKDHIISSDRPELECDRQPAYLIGNGYRQAERRL